MLPEGKFRIISGRGLAAAALALAALGAVPAHAAATLTTLYSFCAQGTSCTDGQQPVAGLITAGNLFGTTFEGGAHNVDVGTVFELAGSGFVPPFAGTPGAPNCRGESVSALAQRYGGLSAAAARGYSSVPVLQNAITAFCAG
jgi:hypothetical protein